jgi:frataxin-like iron-binding protein CyaY
VAINDLAVNPQNHHVVWAATESKGLWRTTNDGSKWIRLSGLTPEDIRSVALDPTNPNLVYAGARNGGVRKGVPNANGTWTWHTMAAGMDPNDSIYSLAVDPARPSRVWAGSPRTGVRYWDPIEQQWIIFNQGLEMRTVFDLDISNDGKVLYAATHGGGVYRLRLSE